LMNWRNSTPKGWPWQEPQAERRTIRFEDCSPRTFRRPAGARGNVGSQTWGLRASGAPTPGYTPPPLAGLSPSGRLVPERSGGAKLQVFRSGATVARGGAACGPPGKEASQPDPTRDAEGPRTEHSAVWTALDRATA
jgi:hypothetical protein